jgi:TPR repeat protein
MSFVLFLVIALAVAFVAWLFFRGRALKLQISNDPKPFKLDYDYAFGRGFPELDKLAAQAFAQAAEQGDVEAYAALGFMHISGIHFEKSVSEAVKWYKLAAEKEHPLALNMLSYLYAAGEGVPKDEKLAVQMCQKAAELGQSEAQKNLANMLLEGKNGFAKNSALAAEWYRKAAKGGNVDAQLALAHLYYDGDGVPQDYEEAERLYEMAAQQGNINACHMLGLIYDMGTDRHSVDKIKAFPWFLMAAEKGHKESQTSVGFAYLFGDGVPKDQAMAAIWFEKAANQDDNQAEFALGNMYLNGWHFEQNHGMAKEYFQRASLRGNKAATEALDHIYQSDTDKKH